MKQSRFPAGWDGWRVQRVLAHYELQLEDEAVAEDEAAAEDATHTLMEIPRELVPAFCELIVKQGRTRRSARPRSGSGTGKPEAQRPDCGGGDGVRRSIIINR